MSEHITGWERDRRSHFDDIVINYDRIRPTFPDEVFEDIFQYAGKPKSLAALEIGAGTGKATRPFLDAGYDVTAVEIGANMTAFLLNRFKAYSGFRVLNRAFEDVELPEHRYDLVYAASAFHWIDAEIGCPKVFNLLKCNGVFALLRYNFNTIPAEGEALHEELQSIYEKYYFSYYTSFPSSKPVKITHELLAQPAKIQSGYGFDDMSNYGFTDITMNLYDKVLTYSADDYIVHLDTLSDHRSLPDNAKTALYTAVKEAIVHHGGFHKTDCIFQLYMGKKPKE